jgi:hypothetical protein
MFLSLKLIFLPSSAGAAVKDSTPKFLHWYSALLLIFIGLARLAMSYFMEGPFYIEDLFVEALTAFQSLFLAIILSSLIAVISKILKGKATFPQIEMLIAHAFLSYFFYDLFYYFVSDILSLRFNVWGVSALRLLPLFFYIWFGLIVALGMRNLNELNFVRNVLTLFPMLLLIVPIASRYVM